MDPDPDPGGRKTCGSGFPTLIFFRAAAVSSVPVGTAECGNKTRVDLVEHLLNPVKDGLHLATRHRLAEVLIVNHHTIKIPELTVPVLPELSQKERYFPK
jgi:hypothetical protein